MTARSHNNEINNFIDYITNPTHIWDATKYKSRETVFYVTENERNVFNFTYTYILGTAYMVCNSSPDDDTVEVFYRESQGFQVVTSIGKREISRASFPPHGIEEVKAHINRIANM